MTINLDLKIILGYVLEFAFSAFIYLAFRLCIGPHALAAFVGKTADEWNDLTGVLFSGATAVWLTYVNIQTTDFGEYLRVKEADSAYTKAFVTSMVVFFLTTVSLISCKGIEGDWLPNFTFFLLLYSAANLLTLIRNLTFLIQCHGKFKRLLRKVLEAHDSHVNA